MITLDQLRDVFTPWTETTIIVGVRGWELRLENQPTALGDLPRVWIPYRLITRSGAQTKTPFNRLRQLLAV